MNGSLDLEWMFTDIPAGQNVVNALLYFNETNFDAPDSQNLIYTWDIPGKKPRVTSRGQNLFPGRIFVTYEPNAYKSMLTNLQYNDTGSFFLRVAIGSDVFTQAVADSAVIRISKINGEYRSLFISSVPVSDDEISEVITKK